MSISRITQLLESLYYGRTKVAVNKFGFNKEIDTLASEDIWSAGGLYPYSTFATPQSLEVISTSAEDIPTTGTGAWSINVIGLDGDLLERSESVNLNGIAAVPLSGTWTAVNRMYIEQPSGTLGLNAGTVSAQVSGGGTVVSEIPLEFGQTNQAVYRVPAGRSLRVVNVKVYTDAADGKIAEVGLIRIGADCSTGRAFPTGVLTNVIAWEVDYPVGGAVVEGGAWVAVRGRNVDQNDTKIYAYFNGVLE